MGSKQPFEKRTYYALTLDPVHIGTGGYRLGRVDNTITREPGTNLPKIPGSSISGAARAYTAMAVQNTVDYSKLLESKSEGLILNPAEYRKMKYQQPQYRFADKGKFMVVPDGTGNPTIERDEKGNEIYHSCAGKGGEGGDSHCGKHDCEVCVAFGFSRKSGTSFQGLAQFFDARILFFPVHSMIGPVWITSPSVLNDFKESVRDQPGITVIPDIKLLIKDEEIQTDLVDAGVGKVLNLGWLLLKIKEKTPPLTGTIPNLSTEILDRLVLVPDKLFPRIVNDNLEIRTSVAIDPATGAAEYGALFTYEAIPRATIMWFDVVYNKPEYFRINGTKDILHGKTNGDGWEWVKENVEKGLKYLETLGVGGMNTRGMGRMRVLNLLTP